MNKVLLPFPMDKDSRPIRNCFFMKRCTNKKCKFNHKPSTDFLQTFPATKPGEEEVKCGMWRIYEEQKRIELRKYGASEEELEELRTNHTLKYINEHTLDELREGLLSLNLEKERLATEAGVRLEQLKLKFGNLYEVVGAVRKLAKQNNNPSTTNTVEEEPQTTGGIKLLEIPEDINWADLMDMNVAKENEPQLQKICVKFFEKCLKLVNNDRDKLMAAANATMIFKEHNLLGIDNYKLITLSPIKDNLKLNQLILETAIELKNLK